MISIIHTFISILCFGMGFFLGLRIGRLVTKSGVSVDEKIIAKPTIKEKKPTKEELKELKKMEDIWNNINNYDGTESSQKEIK